MKLTKNERHTIYKKLLEVVCDDPGLPVGICFHLTDVDLSENSINFSRWSTLNGVYKMYYLPELYKQKPTKTHNNFYWFPFTREGWEKRIAIIEKAIELTK